jgi:hypothetical protein
MDLDPVPALLLDRAARLEHKSLQSFQVQDRLQGNVRQWLSRPKLLHHEHPGHLPSQLDSAGRRGAQVTAVWRHVAQAHLIDPRGASGRRSHRRVEMDKCHDCGALTPTAECLAKIERCSKRGIEFFLQRFTAESLSARPSLACKAARARGQGRHRKPTQ